MKRLVPGIALASMVGCAPSSARPPSRGEVRAGEPWAHVTELGVVRHVSLLRARMGDTAAWRGLPTSMVWEARARCEGGPWQPVAGTDEHDAPRTPRRSWFVDVDACALRLRVRGTGQGGGAPEVAAVEIVPGAKNVLRGAKASDEAGRDASGVVDGTYAGRWEGTPGSGRWEVTVRLPKVERLDRVRVVLGLDGTSRVRAGGRSPGVGRDYGVLRGPARWSLATSEDGVAFVPAHEVQGDVRRRVLVTLPTPRAVASLRLTVTGARGDDGALDPGASPVVREIEAYAAGDAAPLLPPLWVLSVNANPAASSHESPGGEAANDAYYAKFVHQRFAPLLLAMRADDRFVRALGARGEVRDAARGDAAGEALESIEGDDPALGEALLAGSSPPPLAVLSGSNAWEFGEATALDSPPGKKRHWSWNPLKPAAEGGMGQLAAVVRARSAPLVGLCGGGQILALLEASPPGAGASALRAIDAVLRRNDGAAVRGDAPWSSVDYAWPGVTTRRTEVRFDAEDPLFSSLPGAARRRATRELPESHADAIRPELFDAGRPLSRFKQVAESTFCPSSGAACLTIPEAFVSRGAGWPIVATQFHPEQRDFDSAAEGDPPAATADPRLFLAAAFEEAVEAYVRIARQAAEGR